MPMLTPISTTASLEPASLQSQKVDRRGEYTGYETPAGLACDHGRSVDQASSYRFGDCVNAVGCPQFPGCRFKIAIDRF